MHPLVVRRRSGGIIHRHSPGPPLATSEIRPIRDLDSSKDWRRWAPLLVQVQLNQQSKHRKSRRPRRKKKKCLSTTALREGVAADWGGFAATSMDGGFAHREGGIRTKHGVLGS